MCVCVSFLELMQTDKASMLDEIIDYVKFLQLQVKASTYTKLLIHVVQYLSVFSSRY